MVTVTKTEVSTYTITHTATHVADVILGSIADILRILQIDFTNLYGYWPTYEKAIIAWIRESSLECVALECHRPDGQVEPIFEFPVLYRAKSVGERTFAADRRALLLYLNKLQQVPLGTTYKIFCTFNRSPSDQPGWSAGIRSSVESMRYSSFGTLASGPHAGAGLRQYRY